ncbi:MAG: deoxyguanosinetriphosphate triphosphohydrolase [Clostridiales Family XIII bacterium]|jgi:dGTPase|nr:deoxyguanosinetriphosphate triphosphohydrolase [Clostridiales Family XIII bacterium]
MLTRELSEKREYEILSPFAAKAAESRGRFDHEPQCHYRTDYQRDRDRIIHSKALRRLMHKTQVFLSPEGDHYRTRLTHTLEVAQISKSIARALRLNEDLVEAIAMGHDLGHTPFGHNGETFLNDIFPGGFRHNEQSLRVVDVLEVSNSSGRRGMNLTKEVRDGILNHTGSIKPMTLEGQIVKISDRVAYINHDIDDAIRSEIISESDIPKQYTDMLGHSTRQRIDTLVTDLIKSSDGQDAIQQSEMYGAAMQGLREYMFEHIYHSHIVKGDEELIKVECLIRSLYDYYRNHPDEITKDYISLIETDGIEVVVKDHIASMTDRYAIEDYKRLFVPTGWQVK